MDPDVDDYIAGAERWRDEMVALRRVLAATPLAEEFKWRQPCWTHNGHNVVIMGPMKESLTLGFFKGTLLADPDGVLEDNGPNSRSVRRLRFRSVDDVERLASTVAAYVTEAIAVEDAGMSVGPAPEPELCDELVARLKADPVLRAGFASLPRGARREYNLYFSSAKKSATRAARVERYAERIRAGRKMRQR